ncbi:Wzz/FepE/Etk N-terminal domain-containing protein [Nocardioides pyridinolyticus]
MPETPVAHDHVSMARAVRHHPAPVIVCVLLGAVLGWLYAGSAPATYTSLARVLVNPAVGNPYAPVPSSVRQDEATSLETEAQVVRSVEVLGAVARSDPTLTTEALERGVQVVVPPNTQLLEISYSAGDPEVARAATDAVATAYLQNRRQRFEQVNQARIERVAARTDDVIRELRAATAAAESTTRSDRSFQIELAGALRSELVSLRAQRTVLENTETPPGEIIRPATEPASAGGLTARVLPVAGALLGLALGCLIALVRERTSGAVRSAVEVEQAAVPVVAAVPRQSWRARLPFRRRSGEAFDTTIRRLRAALLDIEPRPDVIAVAPAGAGGSCAEVAEAVAESFARAGHRVVLVQTDGPATRGGLVLGEQGLADALVHERLDPMDLLHPSVEPLLCLLPSGVPTAQSRELFVVDRLRAVLAPLVAAGNLVVLQAPGLDTVEGEALVGAADLGLVVVTLGTTRPREVEQVAAAPARTRGTVLAALVVGPRDVTRRRVPGAGGTLLPGSERKESAGTARIPRVRR